MLMFLDGTKIDRKMKMSKERDQGDQGSNEES